MSMHVYNNIHISELPHGDFIARNVVNHGGGPQLFSGGIFDKHHSQIRTSVVKIASFSENG